MDGSGAIDINFKQQENDLLIFVTDSGKGIPSNQFNNVFKAGYTTKKRGWGIGLSLSKRIIEQYHNGKLFVKWSEPSKGTCFCISLPIPPNQDQA
jgi:signal transduction histidine kinase